MAEWSKALDLSPSFFGSVSSNLTGTYDSITWAYEFILILTKNTEAECLQDDPSNVWEPYTCEDKALFWANSTEIRRAGLSRGGACFNTTTGSFSCGVDETTCTNQGYITWMAPGSVPRASGCCICKEDCDHALETGTDCEGQYAD